MTKYTQMLIFYLFEGEQERWNGIGFGREQRYFR